MMAAEHKVEKERRFCPYCDEEVAEASWSYCDTCNIEIFYCPKCRKPVPRDKRICPHCGAEIKGEGS